MVVRSGAILLLTGIAVGLVGSVFAARLLAQQIWNVSTFDPISFAAASVVLLAAGLLACAWPAWRAEPHAADRRAAAGVRPRIAMRH